MAVAARVGHTNPASGSAGAQEASPPPSPSSGLGPSPPCGVGGAGGGDKAGPGTLEWGVSTCVRRVRFGFVPAPYTW